MSVPGMTLNKLCLSGMASIAMADLMISSGRNSVVVTGGMESMSNAPFLTASGHPTRRVPG